MDRTLATQLTRSDFLLPSLICPWDPSAELALEAESTCRLRTFAVQGAINWDPV